MSILKKAISDIISETKNIPYLNHGGCIHFAYFMSKGLSELGVNHKIIGLFNISYGGFNKNFDFVKEFIEDGCSHLLIYIKGIGYFDGTDFIKHPSDFDRRYEYFIRELPLHLDYNDIRKNKRIWNSSYDRTYNKFIERVIKNKVNDVRQETKRIYKKTGTYSF